MRVTTCNSVDEQALRRLLLNIGTSVGDLRGPDVYRAYFGSELYERFRAVKKRFDPKALFGRGSVFEPPGV